MKRSTVVLLKALVWIGCLLPLASLVMKAMAGNLGPDPTAEIASVTGLTALWLLAATLAVTPVRTFLPWLSWLARFRRLLGLFVFFYATLHMFTWLGLYAGFDPGTIATDISQRRFILAGVATYLLLLPLALTSTTWAIRKMGGRSWNRLHMLIYLAAITATVHYWWKVKTGVTTPVPYTLIVIVLLSARPLLAWRKRRKAHHAVTTAR